MQSNIWFAKWFNSLLNSKHIDYGLIFKPTIKQKNLGWIIFFHKNFPKKKQKGDLSLKIGLFFVKNIWITKLAHSF